MLKRLKASTGNLVGASNETNTESRCVREAVLVHSGPEGKAITFSSSDGEIAFDKARIEDIVLKQNEMIEKLVSEYGGWEKIPDGAFPPLLDNHENDSNDRIVGRLRTLLKMEVRDLPKVGKNCVCAIGETLWLGKSTVEKVNDGRIYHLSVGIIDEQDSEKYNTLGETSAVIEPAAPGAMLLKKKKEQAMTKKAKRLAAMKAKMTKLESVITDVTAMSAKLEATSSTVKLAKKQGEVLTKLSAIVKDGRLTPAEFKKLDLVKLAALPDDALKTVVESYEAREKQVIPGQAGSSASAEIGLLGKSLEKSQITKLKSEIKGDLKKLGAKMKDEDEDKDKKKDMSADYAEMSDKKAELSSSHMKHMADCEKHLEAGEVDKAKECMKKMKETSEEKKDMSLDTSIPSEEQSKSMDSAQGQIDELKTQLARLAGIVKEMYDVEKEEHEMESSAKEETVETVEMSDDDKEKEKAKLKQELEDKEKNKENKA